MAPSSLQGLNVVHTAPPTNRDYSSDSQDLLDYPTYRDFNAQLDLWTNLTFESDEPFLRKGEGRSTDSVKPSPSEDGADEDEEAAAKESDSLYPGDAHENVVTGIPLSNPSASAPVNSTPITRTLPGPPPSVDLASFLTSFGIDPYGLQAQQLQENAAHIPTLAQLFSLPGVVPPPGSFVTPVPTSSTSNSEKVSTPAPKRVRTSKSSTAASAATSSTPEADSPEDIVGTSVTAAEDKRRRNTAASARFRLKKKEREAALEKKAKELEVKVNELEKECEGLRRENGWLKGLVVGVTGGVTQQQTAEIRAGTKRGRGDASGDLAR